MVENLHLSTARRPPLAPVRPRTPQRLPSRPNLRKRESRVHFAQSEGQLRLTGAPHRDDSAVLTDGAMFAGYRIVRRVGAGGMGEVYLAQHPRLSRQDAIQDPAGRSHCRW